MERKAYIYLKDVKKLIAGQSCQSILHIASESVRFLEGSIGSWDDRDFDATCGTAPEDDLCCESGTHNPLSRRNGSSEKLSRTELLRLQRSAEKL
jgi:hypothetical protein